MQIRKRTHIEKSQDEDEDDNDDNLELESECHLKLFLCSLTQRLLFLMLTFNRLLEERYNHVSLDFIALRVRDYQARVCCKDLKTQIIKF